MISFLCVIALQQNAAPRPIMGDQKASPAHAALKVAVLPWQMKVGVEAAQKTVRDAIGKVMEAANYEAIPEVRAKAVWEEDLRFGRLVNQVEDSHDLDPLPTPEQLLRLGQALGVDLVCAGRAKWHTRSIWVSLGPKTKSDCTVDVLLVDVKKKEVVLDAKSIKADDTKVESALETAGAIFLSMGITAVSGGPKTPHEQTSGAVAVVKAFDPWLKTKLAPPKTQKINP